MPPVFTRRDFLTAAAGATTLGLGGCFGFAETCATGPDGKLTCALPQPSEAPFDTVGYTTFDNYFFSMQGPTWENLRAITTTASR